MPEPAGEPLPVVKIEGVDEGNSEEVLRLEVAEEHLSYVSPVAEMLEGLGEDPAMECYAIRAGDGEVVGFFVLDFDEERVGRYGEGRRPCGLRNYLISPEHQGCGYGRAAIPAIVSLLRREHAATRRPSPPTSGPAYGAPAGSTTAAPSVPSTSSTCR